MEWIATEWQNEEHYKSIGKEGKNITIHRFNSPYYSGERFAVRDGCMCLSTEGEWEYEPSPSNRTDRFYEEFRFKSFEKAKEMAEVKLRSSSHD